jgi:hypothetical protein
MEINVFDIDDSEPTPEQRVGNWLCMIPAVALLVLVSPLLLLKGKKNVQMDSPPTKPSL